MKGERTTTNGTETLENELYGYQGIENITRDSWRQMRRARFYLTKRAGGQRGGAGGGAGATPLGAPQTKNINSTQPYYIPSYYEVNYNTRQLIRLPSLLTTQPPATFVIHSDHNTDLAPPPSTTFDGGVNKDMSGLRHTNARQGATVPPTQDSPLGRTLQATRKQHHLYWNNRLNTLLVYFMGRGGGPAPSD